MTTIPAMPGGPVADALRAAIRRYLDAQAEAKSFEKLSVPTEERDRELDAVQQITWKVANAAEEAVAELLLLAAGVDVARRGLRKARPNVAVVVEDRLWIVRRDHDETEIGSEEGGCDMMHLTTIDLANVVALPAEAAVPPPRNGRRAKADR